MSLESRWPSIYEELLRAGKIAEGNLRDVADIEFTVEDAQLFVNQIRPAKMPRSGKIRAQLQLMVEGLITPEEFLERIKPADVAGFLIPEIVERERLKPLGRGLRVCGGATSGRIVFWPPAGMDGLPPSSDPRILVVRDRFGIDPKPIWASDGVLDAWGGTSDHPALICRTSDTPCVVCRKNEMLSYKEQALIVPGFSPLREGNWLTIDGMTGEVYAGQARIETKPWKSHPELRLLSFIIEQAVSSGNVPPSCAGSVWRIWDFFRHELPLIHPPTGGRRAATSSQKARFTRGQSPSIARKAMVTIVSPAQANYSEIVLGIMTMIERHFRSAGGGRQTYCRVLWDPNQQYRADDSSQLVGFEFFGINRRIEHLIEISQIRFHLKCQVESPSEAWIVQSVQGGGLRMVPKSRRILACSIAVNGAQLAYEDIPKFYTWLRRREYYWHWFEEHQTSYREITTFLKKFKKTSAADPRLAAFCWELGLLRKGGLTAAGLSLTNPQKMA